MVAVPTTNARCLSIALTEASMGLRGVRTPTLRGVQVRDCRPVALGGPPLAKVQELAPGEFRLRVGLLGRSGGPVARGVNAARGAPCSGGQGEAGRAVA